MSGLYEHYPIAMWIIDGVLWAIGLLCWIATYIGAPLESRKRGYHVSGVPGVAFVFFLLAGFFSPDKWLMLIALLDFSLTYLPVFLLKEHLKKGKSVPTFIYEMGREGAWRMKKLTKEEKHKQCVKEIRATLIVVGICFLWHVLTAFLLNSVDWTLFHMPAWFVVSVLGTVVIAIIGVFWLLRFVFIDFSYEEDAEDEQ